MALRLSPQDQEEYSKRCLENEAIKQAAISSGDAKGAKRARQSNTALYKEFECRQLPEEPPTRWEIESRMTLEQRILRIEAHLKLGEFAEN